jgi:NADH:ubiquinone oxidoreductase subunit 6 (subunit J)
VGERIAFGIAAAAALVSGGLVITLKSAFRATVALIVTLLSVAVLFLIQSAQFVAAIQVIVYAGAIVVLFLFVIAYLGERPVAEIGDRLGRYQVFAWIAVIGLAIQGVVVLATTQLPGFRDDPRPVDDIGSPEAIGRSFIDTYIVPFEATSLALLVAAVGAVLLAKRAVRAEGGR